MILTGNLFNTFPDYFVKNDGNVDEYGVGDYRAIVDALVKDVDEQTLPKGRDANAATRNPLGCNSSFLTPMSYKWINPAVPYTSEAIKRKLLSVARTLLSIKGTTDYLKVTLLACGFNTVTVTELDSTSTLFDNDPVETFDDGNIFDGGNCGKCGEYDVNVDGSITVSDAVKNCIIETVLFNNPIWAKPRNISYNSVKIN